MIAAETLDRHAVHQFHNPHLSGIAQWSVRDIGGGLVNRALFSSLSDDWATPRDVYEALDREFSFNFDPCPLGGGTVDGTAPLFSSWRGKRVFCNPPYSDIRRFLERASEANVAVFLLPSRTDTSWFHEIVLPKAQEIRFIRGRLRFGSAINSAPFPSMIAVFSFAKSEAM